MRETSVLNVPQKNPWKYFLFTRTVQLLNFTCSFFKATHCKFKAIMASICLSLFAAIVGNNSPDSIPEQPVFHSQIWPFFSRSRSESTSANCSLPLMLILRASFSATTCLWGRRKSRARVHKPKRASACSLRGDVSFDFLLITQHALCSVVNCPGPFVSSLNGEEGWFRVKRHHPFFSFVCLLIYSLPRHGPFFSYVTPQAAWMQIKCLIAQTGQSHERKPTCFFIVRGWTQESLKMYVSVWVRAGLFFMTAVILLWKTVCSVRELWPGTYHC